MKLTITIDSDLHKVVPIEPTNRMTTAAACTSHDNTPSGGNGFTYRSNMAALEYKAMIEAVPVDLPGVVKHSGEPCAYETYKGYLFHANDPVLSEYSNPMPLFDHPPAPTNALAIVQATNNSGT